MKSAYISGSVEGHRCWKMISEVTSKSDHSKILRFSLLCVCYTDRVFFLKKGDAAPCPPKTLSEMPYHPLQPDRRHQHHCYLHSIAKQHADITAPFANELRQPKLTQHEELAEQAKFVLALLRQISSWGSIQSCLSNKKTALSSHYWYHFSSCYNLAFLYFNL